MKTTPQRWVRDLAPIPVSRDRELRLAVVDINGNRRVSMATWCKGNVEWHKLPGQLEIPIDLLGELRNRLSAATVW